MSDNVNLEESYLDYMQDDGAAVDLSQLQFLAEQQTKAEAEVKKLEAQLTKAREALRDLNERQVPEFMDEAGLSEFKTTSGLTISVDEKLRASIPKAKAPFAFEWLRQHGHEALIKRVVGVSFGKGESEKAQALHKQLSEQGLEVADNSSVHPQTLAAFVKEKLREGEEIPLDLFGVHRQRVSKITHDN